MSSFLNSIKSIFSTQSKKVYHKIKKVNHKSKKVYDKSEQSVKKTPSPTNKPVPSDSPLVTLNDVNKPPTYSDTKYRPRKPRKTKRGGNQIR